MREILVKQLAQSHDLITAGFQFATDPYFQKYESVIKALAPATPATTEGAEA